MPAEPAPPAASAAATGPSPRPAPAAAQHKAQPKAPARRQGGSFVAGATSRLLPASVPLRWFGAAAFFHACAWAALGAAAADLPQWRGGLGWPLAALHLWTIGTLLASAIGASLQLLPVATRQGTRAAALAAGLWWLFVPGVALLVLGMGLAQPAWLAVGAAAVIAVLLAWAAMMAMNLAGARGMPGVVLHGWGAIGGLALLVASAASLVAVWTGSSALSGWLAPDALRAMHAAAGIVGVMGLLVLGIATIVVPMFALSPVPAERPQAATGALGLAALVLWLAAAPLAALFSPAPAAPAASPAGGAWLFVALRAASWAAAAAALAVHLAMMRRVRAEALRPGLGGAAWLFACAWGAAVLALGLLAAKIGLEAAAASGAGAVAGIVSERLGRLVVVLALVGWLGSFLFGVLHRILPFLAAAHASRGRTPGRRAPTPSALTSAQAVLWHTRAHTAALGALAVAAVFDAAPLWALAAVVGGAGGIAFAVFYAVAALRLRASLAAGAAGAPDAAGAAGAGAPDSGRRDGP
ncbi:MAG: hypothetical protein JNL85_12145 [Rubrivivax sp.]|nr:hypothetical protein [Rubrivivax sp.]